MPNPGARSSSSRSPASTNVDLIGYNETLDALKRLGRFIDPETPFAEEVLGRLRNGESVDEAVAAALSIALAHLDD